MRGGCFIGKYKFSIRHKDPDVQVIQREIEDKFAIKSDLNDKYNKVASIQKNEPQNKNMSDGETIMYDDGTNVYRYHKTGGRLFKQQLTEVT